MGITLEIVSAALSAAAVYAEWAPLPELMRSGLMEACGHFLSSSEFRSQACEVLRHVAHRRRGDTINDAIKSGAKGDNWRFQYMFKWKFK